MHRRESHTCFNRHTTIVILCSTFPNLLTRKTAAAVPFLPIKLVPSIFVADGDLALEQGAAGEGDGDREGAVCAWKRGRAEDAHGLV